MKRGRNQSLGYTIVEVLVVLTVSSMLLVSALLLVGGAQNKTEFNQAIRDIQQQINDVSNNVGTGYYARPANFNCDASGPSLTFPSGASQRGANKDCIFIGRVIKFSTTDEFTIYNIAGARTYTCGVATCEVSAMTNAKPTVVSNTNEKLHLKGGLIAKTIKGLRNPGANTNGGSLGFFSTLGKQKGVNPEQLENGAQQIDVIDIGTVVDPSSGTLPSNIDGTFVSGYDTKVNPNQGVELCFQSGTTDQYGVITIGGAGQTTGTSLKIAAGTCP